MEDEDRVMKLGEVYYRGSDPLGWAFEVLKVKDNYAYLGHFNGDCCKMISCHTLQRNLWHAKRSDAMKARIESLDGEAKSWARYVAEYEQDESCG